MIREARLSAMSECDSSPGMKKKLPRFLFWVAIILSVGGSAHAQDLNGYWYYCSSARAYYPYVQACPAGWQRVAPWPRANQDRVMVPVEESATAGAALIYTKQGTLDLIDALAKTVRANGYPCDSISALSPYFFSHGVTLLCNKFAYSYDFEDHGHGPEFVPPK